MLLIFAVLADSALFGDAYLDEILQDTLSTIPTPAVIWKESYGGRFPTRIDTTSNHQYFSAANIISSGIERYEIVKSALYAFNSGTGSSSCYFFLLLDDESPYEVTTASGASIQYTSGKGRNLPLDVVRQRLREAEILASQYSKLEPLPGFQNAALFFLFSGIAALLWFPTEDLGEKRVVGSVALGLAGLGTVFSVEGIVETIGMNTIRERIKHLWE
jgi:hypothetical protein